MITVVAIGKKHESWVHEGIERYQKRLRTPFEVTWKLLPHSSLEEELARHEESTRLLQAVGERDFVVLLDEAGEMLSSPQLESLLSKQFSAGKNICLVIGGAYGVDETFRSRADVIWSLSKLVFPHQLVRLMLVEQLYRVQSIQSGHPYHHT